jgi:hypothetical protein
VPIDPEQERAWYARRDGATLRRTKPLRVLKLADVMNLQEPAALIDGVLSVGSFGVLYGEPGCGKTFIGTDLGLHLAFGLDWHGHAVAQCGVAYVAGEGAGGLGKRVRAWAQEKLPEDFEPAPFFAIPETLDLRSTDGDLMLLVDAIGGAANGSGRIGLIVIDTLMRAMAGGNENAPEDMGAFILTCDKLRELTGAAVLVIHHSGKDTAKGARGHSSLRGATDTEIEVTKDDYGSVKFKITKQRDMEVAEEMSFALAVVALAGSESKTCVLKRDASGCARPDKLKGVAKIAYDQLVGGIASEGEPLPREAGLPNCIGIPTARWRERFYSASGEAANQQSSVRAFHRAYTSLYEKGIARIWGKWVWLVKSDTKTGQTPDIQDKPDSANDLLPGQTGHTYL